METDQDVTLVEMAKSVFCDFMDWPEHEPGLEEFEIEIPTSCIPDLDSNSEWQIVTLNYVKESLDVIKEVEEALPGDMIEHYMAQLQSIEGVARCEISLYQLATADPETRLRAIYSTLQESGEI